MKLSLDEIRRYWNMGYEQGVAEARARGLYRPDGQGLVSGPELFLARAEADDERAAIQGESAGGDMLADL